MRLVLGLAAASSLLAAAPRMADACSAPGCWPGEMTPNTTTTTVPQNLPGIFWKPQRGYTPDVASDPNLVVLATTANPSTPLPFTTTALANGVLIVPTNPLLENTTYTVTDGNQCEGYGVGPTASFSVGSQAPLPAVLGTVEVASEGHDMIDVASASGSCSAQVLAHRIDISPNFDALALPWTNAFHFEIYVDGELWSRSESINTPTSVRGTWRLYRVCESELDPYLLGSGLTAAAHEVKVKATIPGSTTELWTVPITVIAACPGEGVDVNGDGDGDDEVGGCNATRGSGSAWLLFALALGYSTRRKRRIGSSSPS